MGMRVPLIAGNWKMYKTREEALEFARRFKELYHDTDIRAAVIAPYTQLDVLVGAFKGSGVGVGAQNVHFEEEGAFTGEVSVPMLKELGVDYCLVGHSERRQYFGETDETVNKKLKALKQEQNWFPQVPRTRVVNLTAAAQEEMGAMMHTGAAVASMM